MSKYTYNTFTSLANEGSFIAQLNENFSTLQTLLDLVVSRDGTSPNTMTAALDFNSQNANNIATLRCASLVINGVSVVPADGVATTYGEIATDGTVSSPALYFATDTNTGFYRVGADAIGVSCGGSQKAEFNAAGLTITGTVAATAATAATGTFTALGSTNATITNITVSGTVSLPAFALNAGTTGTTQTPGDNSTKLATTAFVTAAIAAAAPTTPVVQQVQVHTYTTQLTCPSTDPIPIDGTIPQNTEGTEATTFSFTPTDAASYLLIEVDGPVSSTTGIGVAALFVDSTADALVWDTVDNWYQTVCVGKMSMKYYVAAGSTSARTYKLRVGPHVGTGTAYVNRPTTAGKAPAGKYITTIKITEFTP